MSRLEQETVAIFFGGLAADGRAEDHCARMAAAAERWPQVPVTMEYRGQAWYGRLRHSENGEHSQQVFRERDVTKDDSPSVGLEPEIAIDPTFGEARLRSGIAPLFYSTGADAIYFGSDPVVVGSGLSAPLSLDDVGMTSLLLFDYLPPARTLFQQIKQLAPLTTITGSAAGWSTCDSVASEWLQQLPSVGETTADEAASVFLRGIRGIQSNGVPSLVPLTGGIDSRTILAAGAGSRRFETYTRGAWNAREVTAAGRIARAVGVTHRSCPFPAGYLQMALPRIVHLTGGAVGAQHGHAIHPLRDLAGRRFHSILPGTNGEFGRGFWNTSAFDGEVGTEAFWQSFLTRTMKVDPADVRALLQPEWQERFQAALPRVQQEYIADLPLANWAEHKESALDIIYLLRRVARFMIWGPYIWSSAAPVELPFLHADYVRAAAGLPTGARLLPEVSRRVLNQTHPRLLRFPLEPSGRRIAEKQARLWQRCRRKWERLNGRLTTSPQEYATWLRLERPFVQEMIDNSRAVDAGVFSAGAIRSLWARHLAGEDGTKLLMKYLTVELALRIVRDREPVDWEQK